MIVHHDEASRVQIEAAHDDVARTHTDGFPRAARYNFLTQETAASVEVHHANLLDVVERHCGSQMLKHLIPSSQDRTRCRSAAQEMSDCRAVSGQAANHRGVVWKTALEARGTCGKDPAE